MDMANSRPVRMLDIPDDVFAALVKKNSGFSRITIKKGTYPGMDADVQSVQFPAHVIVSCKLPDDVVYNMAKSMTEALAGPRQCQLRLQGTDGEGLRRQGGGQGPSRRAEILQRKGAM